MPTSQLERSVRSRCKDLLTYLDTLGELVDTDRMNAAWREARRLVEEIEDLVVEYFKEPEPKPFSWAEDWAKAKGQGTYLALLGEGGFVQKVVRISNDSLDPTELKWSLYSEPLNVAMTKYGVKVEYRGELIADKQVTRRVREIAPIVVSPTPTL